jgi:hypothetical protein
LEREAVVAEQAEEEAADKELQKSECLQEPEPMKAWIKLSSSSHI